MRDEWGLEELIACWTLDEGDWRLLANKTGATRLGFVLLLKFFDLEGRFPADCSELPAAVVEYVAKLVMVAAGEAALGAPRHAPMAVGDTRTPGRPPRKAPGTRSRRLPNSSDGVFLPIANHAG